MDEFFEYCISNSKSISDYYYFNEWYKSNFEIVCIHNNACERGFSIINRFQKIHPKVNLDLLSNYLRNVINNNEIIKDEYYYYQNLALFSISFHPNLMNNEYVDGPLRDGK